MTKEHLNLFIRYLKERGLYKGFIKEAQKFPERRGGVILHRALLLSHVSPTSAIMNLITWSCARLGPDFWNEEYKEYKYFFTKAIEYKQNNKEKYYELFQKIKKINYPEELQ